ncbi:exonuclease domain-containing protein [Aliagarivorans taiwanensis]|uniref:exonuclease domain-containing protein n=1 Tax=Aliagarivorans taiwanensis TaxID=561966 RepID=UPI00068859D5|nr:exonuclease domain-containing protein [Aliagarivorans taiwanensis]
MFKQFIARLSPGQSAYQRLEYLQEHNKYTGSLGHYLATPAPSIDATLPQLEFIALDFETSGLDPQTDKVLSIGTVNLRLEQIDLASAEEVFVRNSQYVKADTATINQILPSDIEHKGISPQVAFNQLLERISGKVVIAHHATIEREFLKAHIRQCHQLCELPCFFIDTLSLEKRYSYLAKRKLHASYQLDDLRAHYNLPHYHAHSAASDALACAELFLAQVAKLGLCQFTLRTLLD